MFLCCGVMSKDKRKQKNQKGSSNVQNQSPLLAQSEVVEEREWTIVQCQLELNFNEECTEFVGSCTLHININKEVTIFKLDSLVAVLETQILIKGKPTKCKFIQSNETSTLTVVSSSPIPLGKTSIVIKYKVSIRDDGMGVYKCASKNKNGILIVTHFEPTFARLCFPCITHNSIRYPYTLSVTIPQSLHCISCMPLVESAQHKQSMNTLHFGETPSIPSYIFAFVIGTFSIEETEYNSVNSSKIKVRSVIPTEHYSPSFIKKLSQEFLSTTTTALAALEKYFDVPFWLSKLDIVAVPKMLLVGMENLGCCFLHVVEGGDEGTLKKDIVHEIAHHWIGNMVGMSLAIKEGIVQYIEKLICTEHFPNALSSKKKKSSSHHQQQRALSEKKSTDPVTAMLMKEFSAQFNEEFYKKSLNAIEDAFAKGDEKLFQQRLSSMLKSNSGKYVADSVIIQHLNSAQP